MCYVAATQTNLQTSQYNTDISLVSFRTAPVQSNSVRLIINRSNLKQAVHGLNAQLASEEIFLG